MTRLREQVYVVRVLVLVRLPLLIQRDIATKEKLNLQLNYVLRKVIGRSKPALHYLRCVLKSLYAFIIVIGLRKIHNKPNLIFPLKLLALC